MQFKLLPLLAIGLVLSTVLVAIEDNAYLFKARGQQELRNLKEFHHYEDVFDNYHLGGISPDITSRKGS